jgi:hypothetical protein
MRRMRSPCGARAPNGHAAAAPPSSVMNSRRLICAIICRRGLGESLRRSVAIRIVEGDVLAFEVTEIAQPLFLVSFNDAEFPMANQRRNAKPPNTVNCTVRKYLTGREIEKLMDHARKHSRYGHRDSTMILVAYRHGLRASEVCDLQWHPGRARLID